MSLDLVSRGWDVVHGLPALARVRIAASGKIKYIHNMWDRLESTTNREPVKSIRTRNSIKSIPQFFDLDSSFSFLFDLTESPSPDIHPISCRCSNNKTQIKPNPQADQKKRGKLKEWYINTLYEIESRESLHEDLTNAYLD